MLPDAGEFCSTQEGNLKGIPWQSGGQDSTLSMLRAWVQSLVGELRSRKAHSTAKTKTNKQKNTKQNKTSHIPLEQWQDSFKVSESERQINYRKVQRLKDSATGLGVLKLPWVRTIHKLHSISQSLSVTLLNQKMIGCHPSTSQKGRQVPRKHPRGDDDI